MFGVRREDLNQPPRICCWLKWAGLVLSLLIAIAWVTSLFGYFYYLKTYDIQPNGVPVAHYFYLHAGCVHYMERVPVEPKNYPTWDAFFSRHPAWPNCWRGIYWEQRPGNGSVTVLPLWIPFLLFAIPTACLWWRERWPFRSVVGGPLATLPADQRQSADGEQ